MGPSDGHPSLVSFVEHWTHRALIYLPVTKYCALCSTRCCSACESPLWPAAFYKFSSKTKGLCHWWISISVSAPAAICFWVGGQCYFFQVVVSRPGYGMRSTAEGKLTFSQVPWLGSIWKSWISAPRTVVPCGTHYLYHRILHHETEISWFCTLLTDRQTGASFEIVLSS